MAMLETAEESMAAPDALHASSSGELPAPPHQFAKPPPPSRHKRQ